MVGKPDWRPRRPPTRSGGRRLAGGQQPERRHGPGDKSLWACGSMGACGEHDGFWGSFCGGVVSSTDL